MGTYWDLHCEDCGDYLGFHEKSAYNACVLLWFMRDQLANAGDAILALEKAPRDIGVYANFEHDSTLGRIGEWGNLKWFAKHRGHKLQVMTDYGWAMGQCEQWDKGGMCSYEWGHDGPCVSERTAGLSTRRSEP